MGSGTNEGSLDSIVTTHSVSETPAMNILSSHSLHFLLSLENVANMLCNIIFIGLMCPFYFHNVCLQ